MLTDLQVRLSVDNEENIEKLPLLDKIINEKGYASIHQWKIIVFTTIAISLEGMHFNILGMILIPLKKLHDLSDFEIQFISAIMMIFVGIGSFLCGHIINKFPRIRTIKYSILATFILHFLMGCFTNLVAYIIIRIFLGFFIGIFIPLITNLLCEYCPIHHRSFVFNATWVGYNLGCLFFATSQLYLMPNLEEEYLQRTIIFTSILPLTVFIIVKIYLKDSPRNLILLHREVEAFDVLEVFKGAPIDSKDRLQIIQDVKHGLNKEMGGHFTDIFSPKYKFMTLLLMGIWFTVYMLYYGPFLILSWVIRDINNENSEIDNDHHQIIKDEIHVYLIGIIGYFVGGLISEMRIFGRKKGIIFSLIFCIIFTYLGIQDSKHFVIYFGIYFIFLNTPLIVIDVYSCELYPTKIRDIAVGFFFACCRFGSCVANVLYVSLYRAGTFVPFWAVIFTCILDIALTYLVPYETFGMALDTDLNKEDKNNPKESFISDFETKESSKF